MPDEGFRKWLSPDYEVMEDGHAVVGLAIRDDMRNLRDVVQGGVIAALVDVSMATAACGGNYDTRMRPMATMELKVNYTAAATGNRLTATADVISAARMARFAPPVSGLSWPAGCTRPTPRTWRNRLRDDPFLTFGTARPDTSCKATP